MVDGRRHRDVLPLVSFPVAVLHCSGNPDLLQPLDGRRSLEEEAGRERLDVGDMGGERFLGRPVLGDELGAGSGVVLVGDRVADVGRLEVLGDQEDGEQVRLVVGEEAVAAGGEEPHLGLSREGSQQTRRT